MSRKDTILDVLRRAQGQAEVQDESPVVRPAIQKTRAEKGPKPERDRSRGRFAEDFRRWLLDGLVLPRAVVYGTIAVLIVLAWGIYSLGYQSGGMAMERRLAARTGPGDQRPVWSSPAEQRRFEDATAKRQDPDPEAAKGQPAKGLEQPELPVPPKGAQDDVVPVADGGRPAAPAFPGLQQRNGKVLVLRIYTADYSETNELRARHMVKFLQERLPKLSADALARTEVFGIVHEPKEKGGTRQITVNVGLPDGVGEARAKALLSEIGVVRDPFRFDFTTRNLAQAYVVPMSPSDLGQR
ncbi:MAG: hypothetical protein R3F30_11060 [Planctomycetota bacterium]